MIVTYPQLRFESGKLKAITVQIDVAVPGQPKSSFTLSEAAKSGTFDLLVFYYVSDGQRVEFVKSTSDKLTSK